MKHQNLIFQSTPIVVKINQCQEQLNNPTGLLHPIESWATILSSSRLN